MMGVCRSCGAPIAWLMTVTGKHMPCDPEPRYYRAAKEGKTMIMTEGGEVIRATLVEPSKAQGMGFISHFATCPHSEQHRKQPQQSEGKQTSMFEA